MVTATVDPVSSTGRANPALKALHPLGAQGLESHPPPRAAPAT